MRWSAVVPVKRLELAKTRIAVDPADRAELALAMALDTVASAVACPQIGAVLAICDDERARAELAAIGARLEPDLPDAGLNPALEHGIEVARAQASDDGVLVLSSDLPTLTAAELSQVLLAAAEVDRSFVADAAGTGTTILLARAGVAMTPRFGPESAAAHALGGHVRLDGVWVQDIDTIRDLRAALEHADAAAAPRTRDVVARLGLVTG